MLSPGCRCPTPRRWRNESQNETDATSNERRTQTTIRPSVGGSGQHPQSKKQTMADRIIAFTVIACRDSFGLGTKRIRRLYEQLQHELDVQLENTNDTGDVILFDNLHRLGLDDLAKKIVEDYKNEQIAQRGTIFDREANDA